MMRNDLPEGHAEILLQIAEDFESGKILGGTPQQILVNGRFTWPENAKKGPTKYNQGWEFCGTCACIGGHLAWRLGEVPHQFVGKYDSVSGADHPYHGLFWGRMDDFADEEFAARVIREFLDGNDHPWDIADEEIVIDDD